MYFLKRTTHIYKSYKTWFISFLGEYLQIWFWDLRNLSFSDSRAPQRSKIQYGCHWGYVCMANKIKKVKFLKSINQMCNNSPKEGIINQFSESLYVLYSYNTQLAILYFKKSGTKHPSFLWSCQLRIYKLGKYEVD